MGLIRLISFGCKICSAVIFIVLLIDGAALKSLLLKLFFFLLNPDSCEDMLIENCYISVGDDGIAIKSGWDQYGIAYGRPSTNILIRNVTVRSLIRSSTLSIRFTLLGICS